MDFGDDCILSSVLEKEEIDYEEDDNNSEDDFENFEL